MFNICISNFDLPLSRHGGEGLVVQLLGRQLMMLVTEFDTAHISGYFSGLLAGYKDHLAFTGTRLPIIVEENGGGKRNWTPFSIYRWPRNRRRYSPIPYARKSMKPHLSFSRGMMGSSRMVTVDHSWVFQVTVVSLTTQVKCAKIKVATRVSCLPTRQ